MTMEAICHRRPSMFFVALNLSGQWQKQGHASQTSTGKTRTASYAVSQERKRYEKQLVLNHELTQSLKAVTHQRDALLEETTTAAKEKEWLIAKVAQLTVANTEQQNAIAKLEDFNSGWQIAYKNVTASATTTQISQSPPHEQ
ncbi:unnamed protein product, partial [Effrenium voratum]